MTNPFITGAFAAAMAAAGIKPKRVKDNYLSAAQIDARKQAAAEKRKRKAAKLEAAAERGGIRRAT